MKSNHASINQLRVVVNPSVGHRANSYEVIAGLVYLSGNSDSYFAEADASDWSRLTREFDITEDDKTELRKQLKALHLSDSNGVPMHCIANGYYYVQIANGTANYHEAKEDDELRYTNVLMKHLRIDRIRATFIIASCKSKEQFEEAVKPMYGRWETEANECLELIQKIKNK